jgi:hypothetical protein
MGYTVNGQTVTYQLDSTQLQWNFCIQVHVDTSLTNTDTVCVQMVIQPISGDADTVDNTQAFCFPVVNSFDPNDKSVVPAGYGQDGSVLPNTQFTYTIRFQNTGNASAVNISVVDTLSLFLDISTLEIIASSHPMQWSCTNRILKFEYDNINLPDSNAYEQGSHGYVVFRILPLATTPHLTAITNMASIYFDFNPPIYTNHTINTIDFYLSNKSIDAKDGMVVFPNPVNGDCRINFEDEALRTMVVSDFSGKIISTVNFSSKSMLMETSSYSNGLYFITVISANGIVTRAKIIVSH